MTYVYVIDVLNVNVPGELHASVARRGDEHDVPVRAARREALRVAVLARLVCNENVETRHDARRADAVLTCDLTAATAVYPAAHVLLPDSRVTWLQLLK